MAWGFRLPVLGFTLTDRLSRRTGTTTLPTTAGSMSIPEAAGYEFWYFEYVQALSIGTTPRTVTWNAGTTTLSWSAYAFTTKLKYGIY